MIKLIEVHGFKDGCLIDASEPGSDVVVEFVWEDEEYYYFIEQDHFCKMPLGKYGNMIISVPANLEDIDKEIIKRRLAALTHMVEAPTMSAEEEDKILSNRDKKTDLNNIDDFVKKHSAGLAAFFARVSAKFHNYD
jgi:hypothetical protein